MKENITLFIEILISDFFIAFGLISLLFLFISIFTKNNLILKTAEESKKFISFVGIIYLLVWIIGIYIFYAESNLEEKNSMLNRMFGKYWFGFWLQPILWFAITQFLRIEKIWKNIFLRIILSFMLIFSIEKYIIIITSFHRDYLPSSFSIENSLDIYPENLYLELITKLIFFLIFVGIYYVIKERLKIVLKK